MEKTSIVSRINSITDTSNISIDSKPTTARIEISGLCTLNCKFCYHNILKQKNIRQKLMSENDFDKCLNYLNSLNSIKEVGLFYIGESALHPQLSYFYKLLKNFNYFTYLTTNGTIKNSILEAIPYIDSLKISWNYSDEQDFINKTNSSSDMYKQIKNNINSFYDKCHLHNKQLSISTILDKPKESYFNILNQLKYDEHYWLPMYSHAGLIENGIAGQQGQCSKIVSPIPCWCLFNGIYIDVDLNLRICSYGHEDDHIYMNLNNTKDLSQTKIYKIRKQHLNKVIPHECLKCLGHTL